MSYGCERCTELAKAVESVLNDLVELTGKQLTAFQHGETGIFIQLDKQLELKVGEKERCIGAYRGPRSEHGSVTDAVAS